LPENSWRELKAFAIGVANRFSRIERDNDLVRGGRDIE
jgi:hypothetical protein